MFTSTENIGVDKIIASTEISSGQKSRVDKIFALTKCWRRQNSRRQKARVDKNLASTKILRRQNVGACAEASLYCLARQSPQQLTSPKPRWCSPTSPWRCCPLQVQLPSDCGRVAPGLCRHARARTVRPGRTGPPCSLPLAESNPRNRFLVSLKVSNTGSGTHDFKSTV